MASRGMNTYSESRIELQNLQMLKKMPEKSTQFLSSEKPCGPKNLKQLFIYFWSVFFISGVEFFTVNNRKMHTFDLLTVKGDTLRLLIVKCVSYD